MRDNALDLRCNGSELLLIGVASISEVSVPGLV